MNYYINLELKPDAEMRANVLLNTIYTKFHKALCDLSASNIGVSFPNYETTLGTTMRIHGDQATLEDLQGLNWLGGIIGYCSVSEISDVPQGTKHRIVSRIQSSMSQSKLKRLVKRGSISDDEIKQYKAKMFTKSLDNPFIELTSGSNGEKYRRFFTFSELLDNPKTGEFDRFGLSNSATVPWF